MAMPTTDASALATVGYTADAADHLVAGDALHRQYVSAAMAAGNVFTTGDTLKTAVQMNENNAGDNMSFQLWVGVVSEDGTTARATLRSKVEDAGELPTTITNRFLTTTLSGTYETVAGDRLVVEFSSEGTPTAAGGVQGHNGQMRWGSNGAGGDLPENDTDTGTTLNPWIEFATTIAFASGSVVPILLGHYRRMTD